MNHPGLSPGPGWFHIFGLAFFAILCIVRCMNPEYITTTTAARLLGVTSQTIRNWIRSGKITTEPTMGGHNRIPVNQPVIADAIENYVPDVSALDEL